MVYVYGKHISFLGHVHGETVGDTFVLPGCFSKQMIFYAKYVPIDKVEIIITSFYFKLQNKTPAQSNFQRKVRVVPHWLSTHLQAG